MRHGLGLMIGLSAVDTLLSAFTAFLMLSLMIAAPGRHSGGTHSDKLYALRVEKTTRPDPTIGAKLLVDASQAHLSEPGGSFVVFGGVADVTPTSGTLGSWDTKDQHNMEMEWQDCVPTAAGSCTALLAVRAPQGVWKIRFRIAGTEPAYKQVPSTLSLGIHMFGAGSSAGCDVQKMVPEGQIVATVDFEAQTIACGLS
jgi:hypothetical protein